ncbi:HDL071Wp [Eremothecium sinecaudum]|uniref:Tethering factor for nuclear proteasome STS1 n=1 Tax=Eremothecium sinecaudum TaxID=45286 RepID=A0A109UZE6_9SACH|nr:HDL071Wp [Eremothecium sinecaudum]AMD20673.1 HDL071Wp [Eremothecium sinecaudum]
MSQSVGFDWGFVGNGTVNSNNSGGNSATGTSATVGGHIGQNNNYKVSKPRLKRRFTNDEVPQQAHTTRRVAKRKAVHYNVIQGQPLPVSRAIEIMDRETLQTTLMQLLTLHPEIHDSFARVQPNTHDMDKLTGLLERKLQAVYDHIPYSKYGDMLNDYAFVRTKAAMLEFLNCLIDCLLESIPPRSPNLMQSFKFLVYGTRLLTQVPQFETQSNNYYKNICYEQVAEIWSSLIKHASADINFLSSKPGLMHYLEELKLLNKQTKGKLDAAVHIFTLVVEDQRCIPAAVPVAGVADPGSAADELGNNSNIVCNNIA